MFVLALSLYNTWNRGVFLLCKITNLLIYSSMQKFVDAGFKLKEIVIKEQHNCRSTDYWEGKERKFLMLAHEYIFILEKADDHNPI